MWAAAIFVLVGAFLWLVIFGALADVLAAINPMIFLLALPVIMMFGLRIARDRFVKRTSVKTLINLGIIVSGIGIPLPFLLIVGVSLPALLVGLLAMTIVLFQILPEHKREA